MLSHTVDVSAVSRFLQLVNRPDAFFLFCMCYFFHSFKQENREGKKFVVNRHENTSVVLQAPKWKTPRNTIWTEKGTDMCGYKSEVCTVIDISETLSSQPLTYNATLDPSCRHRRRPPASIAFQI